MSKYVKTKHKGIRYREHPTRKYGARPDRYYFIRTKLNGKDVEESLGWESEWKLKRDRDISLEEHSLSRLIELKRNRKQGKGPTTLRQLRRENEIKRDAQQAERQAKIESQKTLSEYWKESYAPMAKLSKKEGSWEKEEQHFRIWIEPVLGSLPVRSIGLQQWDELIKILSAPHPPTKAKREAPKSSEDKKVSKKTKSKSEEKEEEKMVVLSQRSREYITGTLRRVLKHALGRRIAVEAPPTGKQIGIPGPGNNRRLRVITYEEQDQILDYLSKVDPFGWRITWFSYLSGCRISEAFTLVKANVDRSRGVLTFPETKNSEARTLTIGPDLEELFKGMELDGPADALVFTKEGGTPYKEAPSAFDTAVEKLGFNKGRSKRDRITFHSIRHTVATRLGQHLGIRDLMSVMGWRTPQMAMRYVHDNEAAKAKALAMLGVVP